MMSSTISFILLICLFEITSCDIVEVQSYRPQPPPPPPPPPTCELIGCPPGQRCISGYCKDDTSCAVLCEIGSICINGNCVVDNRLCHPPCFPGQKCRNGICVVDNRLCHPPCFPGQKCRNGICVADDFCMSSCPPDQVCEHDRCVCRIGDLHNGRCVTCPPPKMFKRCPTNCPPTCKEPNPPFCDKSCNLDKYCVCPKGLLEHEGGCVRPDECPGKCPKNKVVAPNNCASLCQPTCKDPTPIGICLGACREDKCICREGYLEVDLNDRRCVPERECGQCGPGAEISLCVSFCPLTCQDQTPGLCVTACDPKRRCQCRDGYVQRSKTDTRCIRPRFCPRPHPCDKVNCPPGSRCVDGECICTRRCPPNEECRKGICDCLKGYVRVNGRCVKKECRRDWECREDQECVRGRCVCKKGYVEQPDGSCQHSCALIFCARPKVCRNGECVRECRRDRQCDENQECKRGRCVCKKGYDTQPDGSCLDRCALILCAPPQVCRNGQCVGGCISDRQCGENKECKGGRCICKDEYIPQPGGSCLHSCAAVLCLAPKVCQYGQCVCPPSYLSHGNDCSLNQCNPPCLPGWTCINGVCICSGIFCPKVPF